MSYINSKEMLAEIMRRNKLIASGRCGHCGFDISLCVRNPCAHPEHDIVNVGDPQANGDTLDWFQQKCLRTTTRGLDLADRIRRSGNSMLSALFDIASEDPKSARSFTIVGHVGEQLTRDDLSCAGLGIVGEAGEVSDIIKKAQFHGHGISSETRAKIALELGDAMWYVSEIASIIGESLSSVARRNIAKLEARYSNGFESAASINRKI